MSVLLDRNFEMPSVPIVLSKILESLDENRASAARLEELILHDPSLSLRILKLANSAFYSFRCEVKTISHAIALLGLNLVRSLAIGVSIFESFTRGLRDEAGCISRLWMHSFGVGLVAQQVWTRRSNRAEGEFALLCGLLHDLGQVVFFRHDLAGYSRLFAPDKQSDACDICALERASYEIDHANLGARLAQKWNLPPDLSTVVRNHHDPEAGGVPLVAAVSVADTVIKQAGVGHDGDRKPAANLPSLLGLLSMDQAELDSLALLADSKRSDVEEFFQLTH
jgi:putative nucleotidyltransferase with HDIG domain